jgi:hypothetical protein
VRESEVRKRPEGASRWPLPRMWLHDLSTETVGRQRPERRPRKRIEAGAAWLHFHQPTRIGEGAERRTRTGRASCGYAVPRRASGGFFLRVATDARQSDQKRTTGCAARLTTIRGSPTLGVRPVREDVSSIVSHARTSQPSGAGRPDMSARHRRYYDTRLDRWITANRVKPAHLALESGYSRQHLLRIRRGDMEPTRRCIKAITAGCRRLSAKPVRASDLFDLGDSE